jgi:hypothetical protein
VSLSFTQLAVLWLSLAHSRVQYWSVRAHGLVLYCALAIALRSAHRTAHDDNAVRLSLEPKLRCRSRRSTHLQTPRTSSWTRHRRIESSAGSPPTVPCPQLGQRSAQYPYVSSGHSFASAASSAPPAACRHSTQPDRSGAWAHMRVAARCPTCKPTSKLCADETRVDYRRRGGRASSPSLIWYP